MNRLPFPFMKTIIFLITLVFSFEALGFARAVSESERIWIVRSDGARSCGMEEGESIDQVTTELKKSGVTIFESRKASDGKMHAMVCGAPEGTLNAFMIPKEDLPKAIVLGFSKAPKDIVLK